MARSGAMAAYATDVRLEARSVRATVTYFEHSDVLDRVEHLADARQSPCAVKSFFKKNRNDQSAVLLIRLILWPPKQMQPQ